MTQLTTVFLGDAGESGELTSPEVEAMFERIERCTKDGRNRYDTLLATPELADVLRDGYFLAIAVSGPFAGDVQNDWVCASTEVVVKTVSRQRFGECQIYVRRIDRTTHFCEEVVETEEPISSETQAEMSSCVATGHKRYEELLATPELADVLRDGFFLAIAVSGPCAGDVQNDWVCASTGEEMNDLVRQKFGESQMYACIVDRHSTKRSC